MTGSPVVVPPELVALAERLTDRFTSMWREECTDDEVLPLCAFVLEAADRPVDGAS